MEEADKAREIIANCRRQSRIPDLLSVCAHLRPDVSLPRPPQKPAPESAPDASNAPFKPIHQLRTPVKDFIGRAAEINELVRVLGVAALGTVGATAIICGLGGLGKTQLANMVARGLRDQFPDGQIFLELQGVNNNAIPPERVVQRVIQIFEPQAQVPETLGDLQTFYRSILNGKRVLIVADNAKDESQVRALEPPSGCALLVTSRQHFKLPDARRFDLEALSQAEAETFILKLCPRIKTSASAWHHERSYFRRARASRVMLPFTVRDRTNREAHCEVTDELSVKTRAVGTDRTTLSARPSRTKVGYS